jgi:hypothetical protein
LAREKFTKTSLAKEAKTEANVHEVDDSSLEFPDDDDDVISGFDDEEDDFDFFDASEGLQREPTGHTHKVTRKMKSSMTHSMYG